MILKKIIAVLLAWVFYVLTLSGCSQSKDLHYYMTHPTIAREQHQRCLEQPELVATKTCQYAHQVYLRLQQYEWQFNMQTRHGEQALGWTVLQKQLQLQQQRSKQIKLQQQLQKRSKTLAVNKAELKSLQQQVKNNQQHIEVLAKDIDLLLAVIKERTVL